MALVSASQARLQPVLPVRALCHGYFILLGTVPACFWPRPKLLQVTKAVRGVAHCREKPLCRPFWPGPVSLPSGPELCVQFWTNTALLCDLC